MDLQDLAAVCVNPVRQVGNNSCCFSLHNMSCHYTAFPEFKHRTFAVVNLSGVLDKPLYCLWVNTPDSIRKNVAYGLHSICLAFGYWPYIVISPLNLSRVPNIIYPTSKVKHYLNIISESFFI